MSYPSLIVMPVSDMDKAIATYRALLGIEPYGVSEYYTGFRVGEQEIGLDPNATSGGPLPYWDVEDLDAAIDALVATGATITRQPAEVGGGLTIAVLADSDGNPIGLRYSAA